MLKSKKILSLVFLLLLTFKNFSQERTDSLIKALNRSTEDTLKVNLLNEIAAEYYNHDKGKTLSYSQEAYQLAHKLKYTKGEAKAINSLGIIIQKNGNYDSSLVMQFQALALYKKLNDLNGAAKVYGDICIPYWRKSDYVTALEYQLKALKIYEQLKDLKGVAYSYNMIGIIYKNLKKDNEALSYYLKSAEIKKQISDEKGLASTYQNIGNVYKNKLSEDSAMYYYQKSLDLHKKFNNTSGQGMVISGMGDLKFKFGKYQEAKKYYLLSLETEKEFLDSNSLATSYINIGNVCTPLKDYKSAELYLNMGLNILNKLNDKEGVMYAYEMLAYLFQEKKNMEKALEYTQLYYQVRDSIMSLKEKDQIAELQIQYEVEKKDLEIAKNQAELMIKEKESQTKNIIIISILIVVLLIALLAFIFYRNEKTKQKVKQAAEISAQKEIRSKAIIEAEEKERVRIARDLHDGIGQLLSAAKLNLSSVESKIQLKDPDQNSAFKNALNLLDESVKEVRAVSHNMMPNTLLKLGLASAVREFITKIQNMPNLKVNLEIVGMNERLEQEKESILYRVIQEVVSNIIKHAKASELGLQLIKHERELSVIIEDNGIGFDATKINDFAGIGLKNIISRVEFINGNVHFDSHVGKGTTVVIDVPLTN